MLIVQLLPVILSLLLLGAHFLRRGDTVLMVASLALTALLVVPRKWAARVVVVALALGFAEWVRTLVTLAGIRSQMGAPVGRLIAILAGVAVFTAVSALVFRAGRVRRWFQLDG